MHQTLLLFQLFTIISCYSYLPQLEIDLNAPPKQRWMKAVQTVLELHGYQNSFGSVFAFHNQHSFHILNKDDYDTIAYFLRKNFPEHALELEGVVEALNRPEITFEYMAGWAYFHEIAHVTNQFQECTGVLLSAGDQVIHGRNMDQAPGQGRNLVLHLFIKKDGKYIGEVVDWYWFKGGFITAQKYNVASLEENWRIDKRLTKQSVMLFIQSGLPSLTQSFREVLTNDKLNTYEKVVQYLETHEVGCGLYYIVSGSSKDQGTIITRGPQETIPSLKLNTASGITYLVQTNYDHWEVDPEEDPRRTVAEDLLQKMKINLKNEFGIYAVMNTFPVHNEGTFVTVIMNTKYNRFTTLGQEAITFFDDE
ncbi:unnamed protein product (macronuclear) [Paramecium tetraurelia]|uniref:ceramidase n=1 Tax=Paramecium tetraurelia TaxID=5888 RepID=A0BFT3_PARTE|nr:uncharacterized protein GSPATT00028435001 [Paramecium tetraurelia]CAK57400.1 unnamed protein product [Paramecium tetraurelia]|eukprot:XP_001424798.1 hypothetical protein (macronuclear) [Paramecium tetraurelia strain d4-2]